MKIKPLTSGYNRGRDFLRFCRGQDENNMRGRFFQCFQQRVEGGPGNHMRFINDKDPLFQFKRGILRFFYQTPDVVNAVVGSGVHFNDIRAVLPRRTHARFAHAAWFAVVRAFTVEGTREDFSGTGFAGSAGSAEQVCVRNMIRRNLILQNRCDVRLPDHFLEQLRAVFAV